MVTMNSIIQKTLNFKEKELLDSGYDNISIENTLEKIAIGMLFYSARTK